MASGFPALRMVRAVSGQTKKASTLNITSREAFRLNGRRRSPRRLLWKSKVLLEYLKICILLLGRLVLFLVKNFSLVFFYKWLSICHCIFRAYWDTNGKHSDHKSRESDIIFAFPKKNVEHQANSKSSSYFLTSFQSACYFPLTLKKWNVFFCHLS